MEEAAKAQWEQREEGEWSLPCCRTVEDAVAAAVVVVVTVEVTVNVDARSAGQAAV